MDEDIVEKPVCNILYRQSSLETRLTPAQLSEEDSSDDNEDEVSKVPKIIDYKLKTPEPNTDETDSFGGETVSRASETKKDSEEDKNADKSTLLNESNVSEVTGIGESLQQNRDNPTLGPNSNKQEFSAGTLKGKTIIVLLQ